MPSINDVDIAYECRVIDDGVEKEAKLHDLLSRFDDCKIEEE